jgi:hypothetical protein
VTNGIEVNRKSATGETELMRFAGEEEEKVNDPQRLEKKLDVAREKHDNL